MMHYAKGENVEEEIKKDQLPFEDCWPNGQKDFLWMKVKGGTKVNNVVNFAKNALDKGEHRTIVWTGAGGGLVKTVSCAEIIKRTHPLYQVTRMCYTNIAEHWLPQMEGLDEIVVNRKIPCLHILMSLDEIDESVKSLQKPNTRTNLFGDPSLFSSSSNRHGPRTNARGGDSYRSNQNRNPNFSNKRQKENQNQKDDKEAQRKQMPPKNFRKNQAASSKQGEKQNAVAVAKNQEPKPTVDAESKTP